MDGEHIDEPYRKLYEAWKLSQKELLTTRREIKEHMEQYTSLFEVPGGIMSEEYIELEDAIEVLEERERTQAIEERDARALLKSIKEYDLRK